MGEPTHPDARPHRHSQRPRPWHKRVLDNWAARRFFTRLIKRTDNFDRVRWLGHPVWQNVLDLWTIQETIAELRPDAVIETGTNRGGSSLFFAHLFDLMAGGDPAHAGRVLTIDIERLHDLSHPRITYLLGSSVEDRTVQSVRDWLGSLPRPPGALGRAPRVMVILDSDHARAHVERELEIYSTFVSPGLHLLCQDGVLDTLPMFRSTREGPLPAIRSFLSSHPEFELDRERYERFIITSHPMGWLRRRSP